MKTKKVKIAGILLYCLSGLLLLYTGWAIINCYQQIALLIKQGQLTTSGNEFNIMNFYMTNCLEYGVFAAILFALGWMIYHQSPTVDKAVPQDAKKREIIKADSGEDEDDFDGWDQKDNQ